MQIELNLVEPGAWSGHDLPHSAIVPDSSPVPGSRPGWNDNRRHSFQLRKFECQLFQVRFCHFC